MNLNADLKTIGASPCLAAAMARAEADARSTTKGKLSKSMMKQRVQENAEPLLLQLMDLRNVSRSAYAQLEALTTGMDVDDIVETTATARGRGSRGRGGRGGGRGRGRGGRQMVTVSEEELDADDGANARGGTRGTANAVFRMTLSDGQQCVEATMMAPSLVAGLDERTPIGAKLRIIDPQWLSNGRLMLLHSSNTTLLGGRLEPYATVWTYENRLRRELGLPIEIPRNLGVIAAAENTRPLQASAQETPLRQPPVEVIRIDDDDDDEDDDFMPRPSTVAPPPILQQSALKRPRPPSTETVQCELVRPDATPVFTHDDEQHNENMFDYEAAYGDHFDMDQWLPAVVSSPDRVRAPSPEPKRRLVYLEDIAAGCGSPGDVVFVKAVFMNLEGPLEFLSGTYRARLRMADGIHTAVVDLADALIERWIGMSARDVAAVVRSKNAEEFRRVKKKIDGVEFAIMSTESVFHLQLPEMDENGAYLGLPMLIDLEPLSGEDVRAWLQDLDRDEIVT